MKEILAPAGNMQCALAAISAGADAIYLGYSAFSARAGAENFDQDGLLEIIKKAHFSGVKVYVAMNTLVKTEEVEAFIKTLLTVWNCGADAIILQDAFLGKAIHTKYPEIELHLSTQAGVCNTFAAKLAKEYGFSRVILSRETPIEEIKKIAEMIETEVFVQGALCTAFSGQCYFSSFVGGNSGNRGRCKQPCRKKYYYNRNGENKPVFALSLSDLCVGEEIFKLIDAGVSSFKIEGRMRRPEYVSAAVQYYRSIIEKKTEKEKNAALSDLKRTYNRGNYTKGLAFGQDKRFLSTAVQGHIGEKVGVVKVNSGKYCVESAYSAVQGDAFKILRKGVEIGGAFYEKDMRRGFILSSKSRLLNGDDVFVTTDTKTNERLLLLQNNKPLTLSMRFCVGERAKVECGDIFVYSETELSEAKSSALTKDEILSCFQKTDGLPVTVQEAKMEIIGAVFMAKSKLNALRRAFYDKLYQSYTDLHRQPLEYTPMENPAFWAQNNKTAILVTNLEKGACQADIVVYKPDDYAKPLPEEFINGAFEKYLYFPAYLSSVEIERLVSLCKSGTDIGIFAENYAGVEIAKEFHLKLFAGTGFNLSNSIAVLELLNIPELSYYVVSKELDKYEQKALCRNEKGFALLCGGIKLMDLCYCPFGKTCRECDQKRQYLLTDENGREFPVLRYQSPDRECRFELYNCAYLIGNKEEGVGALIDASTIKSSEEILQADTEEKQKALLKHYTYGHAKNSVI